MSSSPREPGKVPTTRAAFPLCMDGNAESLEEELRYDRGSPEIT